MATKIHDYCYGCNDPIFDGERYEWAVPHGREYEEIFHPECLPYTFFVEEDELYPYDS